VAVAPSSRESRYLGSRLAAGVLDLGLDPGIGPGEAVAEGEAGFPADGGDAVDAEVAGLDADLALDVADEDLLLCHMGHGRDQVVDGDVLLAADVDSVREIGC
jgi:hypothetical protein